MRFILGNILRMNPIDATATEATESLTGRRRDYIEVMDDDVERDELSLPVAVTPLLSFLRFLTNCDKQRKKLWLVLSPLFVVL